MRITSAFLLVVLFAGAAHGQALSVVVDTLDWQRYYPLEIGNTWEYGGLDSYTSTIIGDSLANGHQYFIRRDSVLAVGTLGPFIHTFFHRYDSNGTVITLLSLEEDTLDIPLPLGYRRTDFPDYLAHFDMRMAFGDTLYYGAPDTLYRVSGGYDEVIQIGNESIQVDGLKCIHVEGDALWTGCYATDIGFVEHHNLFDSQLVYARIGGAEYGTPLNTSVEERESLPDQFSIDSIYPNPFVSRTTIAYRLQEPSVVTIEVFNLLGQRIWRERTTPQGAGEGKFELHHPGWPAGIYHVRLTTESGKRDVRPLVVASN